jgi:hypothetical protein
LGYALALDPEAEQFVIEECARYGQPLPDKIANAPELLPGLHIYMTAFHRLSTSRSVGMGHGPIPYHFIEEYADRHAFSDDMREALVEHVEGMDAAFLKHASAK